MPHLLRFTILLLILSSFSNGKDDASILHFESGERRVMLLELYTSQGCSSCPRADAWLSRLVDSEALWGNVVPLAFHVDYWDRLGWKDPFGSRLHTQRQYAYKEASRIGSVYTPGFVSNGKEWRGFFDGEALSMEAAFAENLKITVDTKKRKVDAKFGEIGEGTKGLILNVAVLGFGIETKPSRGENSGRGLEEDFVVLGMSQSERGDGGNLTATLPLYQREGVERFGMAAWVNRRGNLVSIQATGGWLPRE